MKFLLPVLILVLLACPARAQNILVNHGTTIALIIGEDKILFAADSKQSLTGANDSILDTIITCKIHNKDDMWFAISGISAFYDIALNRTFDISTLIADNYVAGMDVSAFFKKINPLINYACLPELTRLCKEADSTTYKKYQDVVFELIMVTFRNNQPLVVFANYYAKGDKNDPKLYFKIKGADDHFYTGSFKSYYLGDHTEFKKELSRQANLTTDVKTFLNRRLIEDCFEKELVVSKKHIGRPLRILQLTVNNFEWLANPCN